MAQAIMEVLTPAIGILISPFPIVGLILILLSDKARSNSIFYMLGWIIGNTAVFLIALFCMGAGMNTGDPSTVARIVFLVLGILLLLLAVREFMKRPKKGEAPKTPKWFAKMSKIGVIGAFGFGFFLSAINPKNLMLGLSAGASAGALGLSGGEDTVVTIVFVLVASLLIILPTIAFLIAGKRLEKVLNEVREWLIHYNAIIMSVLFLFIGLSVISKAF